MELQFFDAQINVHPMAADGSRTLTIVFTEDGERRIKKCGRAFIERMNDVEARAGKALDVCQNEHGKFIVCIADDAAFAEEEALDLKELLSEHVGLAVVIVESNLVPSLQHNALG
jgi:hypothetical protein